MQNVAYSPHELRETQSAISWFESIHHQKLKRGATVPAQEITALAALRRQEAALEREMGAQK